MSFLAGIIRDLHQFDWRELAAPAGIGTWPAAVKASVILLLTTALLAGGYLLLLRDLQVRKARLDLAAAGLTAELEHLKTSVAGLDSYRQRAREVEEPYMRMLRQLPYESEIPSLIDEIAVLGLMFGLEIRAIGLAAELDRPHYVEQPIDIRVVGGYHDIGAFFSEVAALGRIVTLHDFSLGKLSAGKLELSLQARTYRYRPFPGTTAAAIPRRSSLAPAQFPEFHEPARYGYAAANGRDPFAPVVMPVSSRREQPPAIRQPLREYDLDTLRLVGLLSHRQGYTGLVRDPGGAVHRVEQGDYLGRNQGQVQRVTELGVELIEWKIGESGESVRQELLLRWEQNR